MAHSIFSRPLPAATLGTQKAAELLDKHWGGQLPVDVEQLAKRLAIHLVALGDNDRASGLVGAAHWHARAGDEARSLAMIRFDASLPLEQRRFVQAHELGHWLLRHITVQDPVFRDPIAVLNDSPADERELEANQFAASLLMPPDILLFQIEQEGICDIAQLAQTFQVTVSAMRWQLKQLALLS